MCMKKNILLLAITFFVSVVYSQNESLKNVIKITPIVITKGQLVEVSYERQISKQFTATLGIAPIVMKPLLGTLKYPSTNFNGGWAIDPEIRWYASSDKVMDGFFIGLYNSSRFSSWEGEDITDVNIDQGISTRYCTVNNNRYIYGFELGTERMMGKHFVFDFYTGLGYSSSIYNVIYTDDKSTDRLVVPGFNFRLNVSFGYRF